MQRHELEELCFITAISNVPSILRRGILCHDAAAPLRPERIDDPEVQARRRKRVPQGLRLHEYAPLYVCARNPMMFKRKERHLRTCVLRVSTDVLDLPGVVITDQNAASDYVRFAAAPDGLKIVDRELTFARSWTHPDLIQYYRHKARKCAEVLVPRAIEPSLITGVYTSCATATVNLSGQTSAIQATIHGDVFFLLP